MLSDKPIKLFNMFKLSEFASDNYVKWLWHVKCSLVIHDSSQKELASYLGISSSNLSKYLSGKILPACTFYFAVEDFLNQILLRK